MYWCSRYLKNTAVLLGGMMLANSLSSCRPEIKNSADLKYFDLKGFFTTDTARLNKLNKPIYKTVTHNGVSESKNIRIADWGQELNLFIMSDINKPAWRNSYSIAADDDFLIYKAKDPELKTREIMVKMDKKKVKWILIFNNTQNSLYQNIEKLTYYPDSLYLIEKVQRVKVIGTNIYKIKGVIAQ